MPVTSAEDSIFNTEQCPQDGLTKREYFAAMALQGLCSRKEGGSYDDFAKIAVHMSDALIQSLNKEG